MSNDITDPYILQSLIFRQAKEDRDIKYAEEHPASWIWSEIETRWIPPTNPPNQTEPYELDETTISWVLNKESI